MREEKAEREAQTLVEMWGEKISGQLLAVLLCIRQNTENRREEGDRVGEKPEICGERRETEGGGRGAQSVNVPTD